MYVIGLTGGIASGKSTAAETLRTLGAQVIDADAISRRVTAPGGAATHEIMARFGTLDRRTLASIVFADPSARQTLNEIVHPIVQAEMEAQIAASTAPVVVLDVPLLFEAGMEWMANEVWVVHTSQEEQIQRVMSRDGLSEADVLARINSQMSTEEKLLRANASIDTSGTFAQTRMQIEALWRDALARATTIPVARPQNTQGTRRRQQHREMRYIQQKQMETQPIPTTSARSRPYAPPPPRQPDAWEDTSTLLEIPEQRTFFSRQPPIFWIVAGLLLIAMLTVIGLIGVKSFREAQAQRAEERRLQLLAEEKARYKLVYPEWINSYSAQNEIDPAMVAAVIYNESRFDPQAVSYLGARGLMQIMEDTGEWIALRLDESNAYSFDRMFDPETNIRYGTWYLGYLSRLFDGDIVKMAAGYHGGQNAVLRWLEDPEYSSDGVTLTKIPFPDTEQYVQRVVNAYDMYKKHYYAAELPSTPEIGENP